ncbi:MAG: hypothetical protein Q9211_000179 [Gyalolechia sp. 1 TL-2023]
MRNAVQRRNHKERAQPAQRGKWGILEKHKDYSLRAKDYNEKKKRLKILREKATERNPDEFSYGMLSSKTDRYGRKLQDRGNPTLSQDVVKLLKTQDAGYLKTMIQQTRKTREKVEQQYLLDDQNIHTIRGGKEADDDQHIIFAGTVAEQKLLEITKRKQDPTPIVADDLHQPAKTNAIPVGQTLKRNMQMDHRHATLKKAEGLRASKQERALRKLRKRQSESQRSRLKALETRERDLLAAEQQLDHGRARMNNSVGGVNKAGIRWKIRERKR